MVCGAATAGLPRRRRAASGNDGRVRFLHGAAPAHDLTYNDVFMAPARSEVGSRLDVDLSTGDGTGTTIPIVVANMTAVAGRRMAETVARRGAHRGDPAGHPDRGGGRTSSPGSSSGTWSTTRAITLGPDRHRRRRDPPAAQALARRGDRGRRRPAARSAWSPRRTPRAWTGSPSCRHVMSTELHTVPADADPRTGFDRLTAGRRRLAPVVDADGRLVGVLTRQGALRATLYKPAVDDRGRLRVAAAVGINGDVTGKAAALLEAGVDMLVVDTAHGHQERMISALRAVRELDPAVPVAAGNVVTAEGVRDLVEAGADIVKVGVGPGAMCTTRMMTGVGRPQFSAVLDCAAAARAARPARLGRRRRAAPARRGAGAGRRRVQRDDRLLVRRHLRVARRPLHRRGRPALQGELRDGLGAGGQRPDRRGQRRSTGPARRCSRRASPRPGCTWTRPAPASRT